MSQEDDPKIVSVVAKAIDQLGRLIAVQEDFLGLVNRLDEQVKTNAQEARQRDEENQRNIKFILEQQAQFSADMQQLREAHVQADEKWERRWGRTEEGIRSLLSIAEIHDGEIKALADAQAATAEVTAATAEAQARTDRQMAETDERLNALVNVVERLISEKRNGGDAGDTRR
jgi:archaellum component FlaC